VYDPNNFTDFSKFHKRMEKEMEKEVKLIQAEVIIKQLQAQSMIQRASEAFLAAELKQEQRKLRRDIKELRMNEMVEILMAVFEDLPELILGIVFIALGGLSTVASESDANDATASTSGAEISLFVTSEIVSLFHASKCLWSWYKNRT
jgi:hypothetical protein